MHVQPEGSSTQFENALDFPNMQRSH